MCVEKIVQKKTKSTGKTTINAVIVKSFIVRSAKTSLGNVVNVKMALKFLKNQLIPRFVERSACRISIGQEKKIIVVYHVVNGVVNVKMNHLSVLNVTKDMTS